MNEFRNSFHVGDAAEVLTRLPAESVDLVVTSPEYDNLRDYETKDRLDWRTFCRIADELKRILKPGGVICWNVADEVTDGRESGSSFSHYKYFTVSLGLHARTLIFEPAGTGAKGPNNFYWSGHEYVFIFSKGKPKTVNLIEDRLSTHAGQKTRPKKRLAGDDEGSRKIGRFSKRTTIWRYQVGNNGDRRSRVGRHPAKMCEGLARDLILSFSNPGDLVADPFVGEGTVALMAAENSRDFFVIDVSAKYIEMAEDLVGQARRPLIQVEVAPLDAGFQEGFYFVEGDQS